MFGLFERSSNQEKHLRRRRANKNSCLSFDTLERRELLAFSGSFDLAANLVTLTQTADDGFIQIEKIASTGDYSVTDGDGTKTFSGPLFSSLRIELQDHQNNHLELMLGTNIGGFLSMDLGAPDRSVFIEGFGASGVGGSFTVTGGDGDQSISIATLDNLTFNGTVDLDLGLGNDELRVTDVSFGSDIELSGLNQSTFTSVTGAGDLVDNVGADLGSDIKILILENSNFAGDVAFFGTSNFDLFGMEDSTVGAVDVRLSGRGDFFGIGNYVEVTNSVVNESFKISSGSGANPTQVNLVDNIFGEAVNVHLGNGPNELTLTGGEVQGSYFSYSGRDFADTVNYAPAIGSPGAQINMGGGDDSLTLGDVDFSFLSVSFAADDASIESDTFVHSLAGLNYPISLNQLNGYNHNYVYGDLKSTQIRATPKLTIAGESKLSFTHEGSSVVDDLFATESFTLQMRNDTETDIVFGFGIGNEMTGDLKIKLGDGARTLNFAAGAPSIVHGTTSISGGAGNQTVSQFGHGTGGDVFIDLGLGSDSLSMSEMMIAGKFILRGVNQFQSASPGSTAEAGLHVVGNMFVDNFSDDSSTDITFRSIDVDGEFGFFGSEIANDRIYFNNADFALSVFVHLNGDSPIQGAWLTQHAGVGEGSEIHGSLIVLSSNQVPAEDQVFLATPNSPVQPLIQGNVYVNLGDGVDGATVHARLGSHLTYRSNGPNSESQLYFSIEGTDSNVSLVLGGGNDSVIWDGNSGLNNLRIDFGGGFGDNFLYRDLETRQIVDFETKILNFQGFSIYGSPGIDSTHFQQIAPLSGENKVTINAVTSVGGGNVWRMKTPTSNGLVGLHLSTNLSVNMLDDSETSLDLILDRQIGQMRLDLGDGDRDFQLFNADFAGENSVNVAARLIGGTGQQSVNLAAAREGYGEYRSGFPTAMNLGTGHDTLLHDHAVNVGGAFNVQGVNQYENHSVLSVGFNFAYQTNKEERLSIFNNTGLIDVDYNLIYLGGDGVDQVNLGSVTVDNISFVDLGKGLTVANEPQQLLLGQSSFGNFTAKAGDATVGNQFGSIDSTIFDNGLTIDFYNESNNLIDASGQVTGNALIRGGEARDRIYVGISGRETNLKVFAFDGQDTVILETGADLASLLINFGDGIDEFINQFNQSEPFPVTQVNLP